MTTPQEVPLGTLEELGDEEFEKFKWLLYQEGVLEDFKSIPKAHLDKANRFNTVDQMVQTYGSTNAIKVTEKILMKMKKIELVRKITGSIKEPTGIADVELEPNTADTELDPKLTKTPIIFTPEMQTESAQISYRFRCAGPGVFQCAETGLVFVMTQGAELQYRIVQWDESRHKPTGKEAAGPMFDIRCSEDAAVRQIHFPHCEADRVLRIDGLLSGVHFTDDGMDILKPLQITDTHVVVEVAHLSLFGLIWDVVKRWFSLPVNGQVLLFLRSPKRGPRTLEVFLLHKNIPVSQVAAQQGNAEYIEIPVNCSFIIGQSYSLRCEQEGLKIHPEHASFSSEFGPHFHPTFEVFLMTNSDVVTLIIQDQEGTEVWKHDVHLKDAKRDTEQSVQPQDWLKPVWDELINGLSEVNVNLILNRLHPVGVFNAQEMNVIRAQIGADRAQKLIEGVYQKGPDAWSLLKTALREVDPFLFRNLNLM